MTTAAFFAARRVIDRLTELARPGLPLDGVQVGYGWPGPLTQRCVYLGELVFPQVKGPTDGARDTLVQENGTTSLYVRLVKPLAELPAGQGADDALQVADRDAEQIVDAIGDYVRGHADMLGPNTDLFPVGGRRDYTNSDTDVTVAVRLDLAYTCFLGGA